MGSFDQPETFVFIPTGAAIMSDREINAITDLSTLRSKRGARKRNIGKVKTYLTSKQDLKLAHINGEETRRQLEFLDQQTSLFEVIQDRIVELLEVSDPESRLHDDEEATAEQRQIQNQLRIGLTDLLNADQAHQKIRCLERAIKVLEKTDTLHGPSNKEELDAYTRDLRELQEIRLESDLPAAKEAESYSDDIASRLKALKVRYDHDNGELVSRRVDKSTPVQSIAQLPKIQFPSFDGDHLE